MKLFVYCYICAIICITDSLRYAEQGVLHDWVQDIINATHQCEIEIDCNAICVLKKAGIWRSNGKGIDLDKVMPFWREPAQQCAPELASWTKCGRRNRFVDCLNEKKLYRLDHIKNDCVDRFEIDYRVAISHELIDANETIACALRCVALGIGVLSKNTEFNLNALSVIENQEKTSINVTAFASKCTQAYSDDNVCVRSAHRFWCLQKEYDTAYLKQMFQVHDFFRTYRQYLIARELGI